MPGSSGGRPARRPRVRRALGRRRFTGVWVAVIAALALSSLSPAAAQPGGTPGGQIEVELERTDRLLERAAEESRAAAGQLAHHELDVARTLQLRAWKEYRGGGSGSGRRALALTRDAREHALKAIDAARVEDRAAEGVRQSVDEAQERLARIGERVAQSGNVLAERVLDQGGDQLRRARNALRAGSLLRAARLAALALGLLERADRIASEQLTLARAATSSLERTAALISEVRDQTAERTLSESEAAVLRDADDLLARGRERARAGQHAQALRLSLHARNRALDLLDRLRAAPRLEDLLAALEEFAALAADAAAEIQASGNEVAQSRFDEAEELLGEARRLIAAGKPAEALRLLVAGETLLREAVEEAGRR